LLLERVLFISIRIAWLRGRRQEPPSEDEVLRNQAISDMKKENAAELDAKYRPVDAAPKQEKMQVSDHIHMLMSSNKC
jgi:hypothetical protein